MHEAGADACYGTGFYDCRWLEYVRVARDANLDFDAVCSRLSFFFAMGMDHHVEIAKLRAARQLWAEELKRGTATFLQNEKLLCYGPMSRRR